MTKNVYIHIPFCKSKCKYCSFVSYPGLGLKADYLSALQTEIKTKYRGEILETLYFGGGTPSILTPEEFSLLIKHFNTDSSTEITAELNPENIDYDYLFQLKNTGINRLSFGCQTFDDDILNTIGRRHKAEDVINAVKQAQKAGFENISIDFIYGLPNQTAVMFEKDLIKGISLGIQHISLYGLKIDEDCYFYTNPPQNLPDDDVQADMYSKAVEILKDSRFIHYEISNFAKNGYYSKHNLNYWKNNSYYGFGTAAHGYENGIRYNNTSDIESYIKNPIFHSKEHFLTTKEKLEEEIFLGFRNMSGINCKEINKKFSIDFENKYRKVLAKYTETGHLMKADNEYRLTEKGILVSNIILSEFLD